MFSRGFNGVVPKYIMLLSAIIFTYIIKSFIYLFLGTPVLPISPTYESKFDDINVSI